MRSRLAIARSAVTAGSFVLLASASFTATATAAPAAAATPSLPPARVTLTVTPGSGGAPWSLKIENAGDVPVRVPGNARLLSLELTPRPSTDPKAKKAAGPLRCALPEDARPSTDEGYELVVPSKRSWSATFNPLFYCFGARERAALVAGTSVKARFGWASPAKGRALSPPLAVTPVGAAVGKVEPAKAIDADAFVLTEAVTAAPASSSEADTPNPVTLSVPESIDAARGVEIGTTVTLANGSDRPITLLYRPDMLLFTVSTPAGSVSCGAPRQVAAPIRELFTTVPVNGKIAMGVLVTAICPAGTFDEPGIYRIMPRIDTTGASGRALGLKTWEGVATGKTPLLLRVRTPRTVGLPARPTLD